MRRMAGLWRYPLIILPLLSALALGGAYLAEYGFDLPPCELCLKQRIPFYLVILLGIPALMLKQTKARTVILLLMSLAFLANAGIAGYHTGVEQKWWPGPSACSGEQTSFSGLEELREHILSAPVVRCDEPAIEFFGFVTMASANFLFSLLLAVYAAMAVCRYSRCSIARKDKSAHA